ncbi:ABC transporter, solute-binding protein [Lachnoanaerobaculum saburreum F0468]|uniref:ABC transporter, solute-binding protein n=1 Tax=Lachnoanaerobaculum saburreum F0468 TaxID=1095750 RepID=I0RBI5_9FIRM|nr:extracellular solute-binding protein [Lachnoanaerobaculum saburreum]EIC97043.1 ABC transporter, solute-binding protein [Lachnoanaerobaculum saburreum F0468]
MKKRFLSVAAGILAVSAILAGCGSGAATNETSASGADTQSSAAETKAGESKADSKAGEGALRLVNGKIEIDSQLKKVAEKYKEKTGQEVVIESLGGGVDIQGQLKSYKAADNMPDIFVIGGDGDYANWTDSVADLSDSEFAKNTDFAYKDKASGKVVGFPYAVEGYGITYNADILEKAGIDPETLKNYDAFKAAFEKLDSMKSELGLQAVASVAAESGQMYWSTGNHLFGYYYTGGLDRGDNKYFDMAMKGEFDDQRLSEFADMTALLFKYADPQVLISGTYDDQLALWAQGKTAFITQGNWIDPSLPTYNVTFKAGLLPLAFTKADMTKILADCPSWWCVYKDGKNVDAAKKFLDYLATDPDAQEILVKEAGMISPYKTSTVEPETPLAVSLKKYVDAGNTSSWAWSNMPEGIAQNKLGLIFESFAKGDMTNDQFVTMMKTTIADYVAANKK